MTKRYWAPFGQTFSPHHDVINPHVYWGHRPREAQRAYVKDIENYFGKTIQNPWEGLKGGLILGSENFVQAMNEKLEKKKGQEEIRWVSRVSLREIQSKIENLVKHESDERVNPNKLLKRKI